MRYFFILLSGWVFLHSAQASEQRQAYVGRQVCMECHQEQATRWSGSHHDLAMDIASEKTVLGDFDDASVSHFGVTTLFYRKGDRFMVRTEGPEGKLRDYPIKYSFGVDPLQQYLIEFPGGRLQALSLAWDARPESKGGQRWFHLYPDEKIAHDDELHWTRLNQNWNNMCAECHSTNLQRNYDPVTETFDTSWSEIDVSCEACHGPGSDHRFWARQEPGWEKHNEHKGLVQQFDERKDINWITDSQTGRVVRSKPRGSDREIDICARCHSRRSALADGYLHGKAFLDQYRLRLLDENMYFPDGQIEGEVYVYGSFLQSRMYAAGVTCSDCHEPHSLALRVPGNGVCLQCHLATQYDQTSHHFHKPDLAGASCAECHMPPRNYMVVDPRHDHSMRIPRPDLSEELGTPNACNNCHEDQSSQWAAEYFKKWYPQPFQGNQQYGEALAAGRNGSSGAEQLLELLVHDGNAPDIARATALSNLLPYLSRNSLDTLQAGLVDENPLVRGAAVELLQSLPLAMRVQRAYPLLGDPALGVRTETARILADIPRGELTDAQRIPLDRATREYIQVQQANAERPEAHGNLGNLFVAQGKVHEAISSYRKAIEINPAFVPGYVNLADVYRSQGDEPAGERVLRQGLAAEPEDASLQHVLGLALVRQKRLEEGVELLRLASMGSQGHPRYVYVYAVALASTGKTGQAILVLQGAHNRFPSNTDILSALVAFHMNMGKEKVARSYEKKLKALGR
ncbi:MAG: tetratricopeptide repeat protein [Gammaproteobacteria bacterium]|nr:tetratricopeptide repeat protein [Gammaproteobacteria bacterium]